MNVIYIIIDICIVIGSVFAVKAVKKKIDTKNKRRVNVVHSTDRFKNTKLYEEAESSTEHLETSNYRPALNDFDCVRVSADKSYHYKTNPQYEHEQMREQSERMMRRTENFMMHQAMMQNNHFNGF